MKYLFAISFFCFSLVLNLGPRGKASPLPADFPYTNDIKAAAFKVLVKKCNSCHRSDLPKKIFTVENMDSYAKKIHKQVFVKKKMPKGDLITLDQEEYDALYQWLDRTIDLQ